MTHDSAAGGLLAMASNLLAMAINLIAMASNLIYTFDHVCYYLVCTIDTVLIFRHTPRGQSLRRGEHLAPKILHHCLATQAT